MLLREITLVVEGRPDVVQDLTDSKKLNETSFRIKVCLSCCLLSLNHRIIFRKECNTGYASNFMCKEKW